LPLPLVSYGGSFLLAVLFSIGILQSVWIHRAPLNRGRRY
jgi:rod shape determining protein RodA